MTRSRASAAAGAEDGVKRNGAGEGPSLQKPKEDGDGRTRRSDSARGTVGEAPSPLPPDDGHHK